VWEKNKNAYIFLIRRPEGERPFGRGSNARIKVNRIIEGQSTSWTGLIWLRSGKAARCCENSNVISGSSQRDEFIDWLRTQQLLKKLLPP